MQSKTCSKHSMLAAEGWSGLQGLVRAAGPAAETSKKDSTATLDLSNRTEEGAAVTPMTPNAQSPHLQHVHRYVELSGAQLAGRAPPGVLGCPACAVLLQGLRCCLVRGMLATAARGEKVQG